MMSLAVAMFKITHQMLKYFLVKIIASESCIFDQTKHIIHQISVEFSDKYDGDIEIGLFEIAIGAMGGA